MKKNGVSVDVVNFGEDEQNQTKLEAFIAAVNSSENNCHLVSIPAASCKVLADVLVASPIIGSSATGRSGEDGEGAAFEFGVDPNLDPELALVISFVAFFVFIYCMIGFETINGGRKRASSKNEH